jgi:hypothetical protein
LGKSDDSVLYRSNLKECFFSDAVTFNLIDGKIENQTKEGEFDENINKY